MTGEAGLAQMVVRLICNQEVGGSIPSPGTSCPRSAVNISGRGAVNDDDDDDAPPRLQGVQAYMTPNGHAQLVAERAVRKTERHRVVEIVSWAAGNGDRSENADYKEGKRRLREIDRRLRFLDGRLAHAQVIDPAAQTRHDQVFFGATVTYLTPRDDRITVRIVGVDEADMESGTVSIGSPVALALLGRRVGEEVAVVTPRGREMLEVVAVAYPGGPSL